MPLPRDEREMLEALGAPAHEVCVARANEFCARCGLSATQFSEALRREFGRCSRVAILWYLRGDYRKFTQREKTTFMDACVCDFCQRHWPQAPANRESPEAILETRGYCQIAECFREALDGINSLIYGPPSAEKSFVLENLALGEPERALYIECGPEITPTAMLRRVCQTAGIYLARAWRKDQFSEALERAFAAKSTPPALIFDEAQLAPFETLEEIRMLHNRTRRRGRPGCGIILAGSHNLYQNFMRADRRARTEQWLSRLPNRVQLAGMDSAEALEIAARAWNPNGKKAKFTSEIETRILMSCEVADPYATDADGRQLMKDGKPVLHTYYSPRRLLHFIRQQKKNISRVIAEPAKEGAA